MNILSILLFSFALLTDTHISSSNPRPMEDLQRSIAEINQNPAIEFVVVTGDLTENGDRASIQAIKDALDQLNVPVATQIAYTSTEKYKILNQLNPHLEELRQRMNLQME